VKSNGARAGLNAGERCLRELPDYLQAGLAVVFVGFNPSEYSCRAGHYYASRRNDFWRLLYEGGLIPEKLGPQDDCRLTEFGIGLTDIVKRCSGSASDISREEYQLGVPKLREKLESAAPRVVAFNGKGVWQHFAGRRAELGPQNDVIGNSRVFVLPSTSPRVRLRPAEKLAYFRKLAESVIQHG
jgi:double-stranded uracil-DNA glycosylase